MPYAIRVHEHGGPEALRWEEVPLPEPQAGEVLVEHTAVGLNFIDVYFRTGLYQPAERPFIPGVEAAGRVTAVGPGVTGLKEGDRVAYATQPPGSYTQARAMPANRLVKLPDEIDDETAAAIMLKGMTAQCLLRRVYPVKAGDTILVHAAAGGVGSLMCQWAKHLGATVIGTVGSADKAARIKALGCDYPILYNEQDFVERVKEITSGRGVDVVYDSVGRATFMKSLDCLRPMGMMVSFGQSSGALEPLEVGQLAAKGSLFLTRPTLFTYTARREDLVTTARELFEVVRERVIKVNIGQRWPLAEAGAAHQALEARATTGSTLLMP